MEPLSFTIDCRELVSRAAAHDCFARVFSLPAGYGRNLDALYDVLTSLPPCRVTLAGTSCLYPLLGAYAEKLLSVFRDAARDNENIQFQEKSEFF
ncbi:MAG: barstar family protein [Oscillospiraceae bacterium]|nr:barstar family protein [Oscillospiraceae bacterium]MCI6096138.1 barstar family protein [Clostridiales bacterium]MCI6529126.1 barstar family protein [Clostridiales bacterium]MCI6806816.1 barstar family protein [Clostridiales bacterium]MCI7134350.1 barstar family protein [Clostridiales bacterium]